MPLKILCMGHRGFVGSHLVPELEAAGHHVRGWDWRTTDSLIEHQYDLRRPGVAQRAVDLTEPDVVVHLAAQVGREFGEEDVIRTITQNVVMSALVAKAAAARGARVVYAGTSEAYGDLGERVAIEGGPQALPHNAYGLAKRVGEEFCELYAPNRLSIVRLSMPYGTLAPPGRGRRALDTFLWRAHHRMPISVHRNAERSWCYVADTVRGIRMVIEEDAPGIINVGRDDDPISMYDLAVKACEIAGADPDELIEVVDPPVAQTVVKRLSTARLRALGWAPTVELDEGMRRVYEWVKRYDAEGRLCPSSTASSLPVNSTS